MTRCSIWDTARLKRGMNKIKEMLDTADAVLDMMEDTAKDENKYGSTNAIDTNAVPANETFITDKAHEGEPTEGMTGEAAPKKDCEGGEAEQGDRGRQVAVGRALFEEKSYIVFIPETKDDLDGFIKEHPEFSRRWLSFDPKQLEDWF